MNSFDLTTLHWFNNLAGRSYALDLATAFFTNYAPLLFAAFFLAFFVRAGGQAERMRRTVILSGLAGLLALGAAVAISSFVYRPRPFTVLPPDQIRLLVPHASDSSFPSDHATGSAAFAAGMWRAPDRAVGWLFAITAMLVGASRLVAGVHWPGDILASFILGALCAQVLFALERPLTPLLDFVLSLFGMLEQRFRKSPR